MTPMRLTPSLLGQAAAALHCALKRIGTVRVSARERKELTAQVAGSLVLLTSEPLPREVAKGLTAHLARLHRSVADPALAAALLATMRSVEAQAREQVDGSPFT